MATIPTIKIGELVKKGEAELQTGPFGTQLKASDYVEFGVPVINVRNVGFGDIRDINLEYLDERMVEKLSEHILLKNDIVFGRKGAVERHAFIDEIGVGWIQGSDCLRLRIKSDRVNNRFISYFFNTLAHQDWMKAVCSFGATMASLNQDIVKLITIPLPEITVQNKISAILTSYDQVINNTNQQITILEKTSGELFKEWFVRFRFPNFKNTAFEKGLPADWSVKKLTNGEKFQLIPNNLEVFEDEKKYYATSAVNGINLLEATSEHTYTNLPSRAKHKAKLNSVWFARMKNTYKVLGINSKNSYLIHNMILSSGFCGIETDEVHFYFLYLLIKSESFHDTKDVFCTGATQESLTNSSLKKIKILYPTEHLIEEFGKVVAPIVNQIFNLQRTNSEIKNCKSNLLDRLISGKLSVENLDIQFPPSMLEDNEINE